MSLKRKSYSVEFMKVRVEESLGRNNLTAFCKEKNLDLRLVRKWRSQHDMLLHKMEEKQEKQRKCGAGRRPSFPELEDIICDWIIDKRANSSIVRRGDIQQFALKMASSLGIASMEFKASDCWLSKFMKRYDLSLRRSSLNYISLQIGRF